MTVSRWTLEPRITVGNILTIVLLAVSAGGFFWTGGKFTERLESRVANVEAQLAAAKLVAERHGAQLATLQRETGAEARALAVTAARLDEVMRRLDSIDRRLEAAHRSNTAGDGR